VRIISFRNPTTSFADIIVESSIITMDFEPLGRELVAEKEKLNSISNLSSDESKRKAHLNSTLLVFKVMLEFSDRHGLIDPKNFDEIGIWYRVKIAYSILGSFQSTARPAISPIRLAIVSLLRGIGMDASIAAAAPSIGEQA